MWQVMSNLGGSGGVPVVPPTPPLASYYLTNMTYLGGTTRGGIHSTPTTYRGTFYDGYGKGGNDGGGYSPFFSVGDTLIQLSFSCQATGTAFPAGSFALDVEDISIATESHTYYNFYPIPPNPPWGTLGSYASVVAWNSTHSDTILSCYEQTGGAGKWSYANWADYTPTDNDLMTAGNGSYSRRMILMPKFNFPSSGFNGQIWFRFYNNIVIINGGYTQWRIHGLYWRQLSDLSYNLIWLPPSL